MKVNMMNEIGSKSLISFIGNIVGKIFVLINGIIFARILGPELFGEFTFVVSVLAIVLVIGNLGLPTGVIAFIPKYSKAEKLKRNAIISFAITLVFIINLLIIFVLYLNIHVITEYILLDNKYELLMVILLPTIIIINISNVLLGIFRALKKIKVYVISSNVVRHVVEFIVFLLLFIVIGESIFTLVSAYYIGLILTILYLFYQIIRVHWRFTWNSGYYQESKRLFIYSIPLLFNGIMIVLINNIDIYMIGYFHNSIEVGIYKLAMTFGNVAMFALLSLNSIFPAITTKLYHSKKVDELKTVFQQSTKWVMLFSLLVFSILLVLSEEIMGLVSQEYILGSQALVLIALGQVFNSIVGPVGTINSMTGRPRYNLYANLSAIIINIALNMWLIPIMGISGAAIATAVSLLISNVIRLILVYYQLKIHPYSIPFVKVFIPFSLATCLGYLLSQMIMQNFLLQFTIISFTIITVFVTCTYYLVCSREEKLKIKLIIYKIKSGIANKVKF